MAQVDYWTETLLVASLDGVVFDVAERRVVTGRKLARYRYPYRNGQGVEDLGRQIYIFTLQIPLYRGVGLGQYPGTFDALVKINDDDASKAEVEYVDPEFGPFRVKIPENGFEWQTTATARDGGMLTLTLEEIGFEQSITQNLNKPSLMKRAAASQLAAGIDYRMDILGTSLEAIDGGAGFPSLTEMWAATQEALDTAALAADDVAAKIDEITLVTQKIMNFSAGDEIERFSLYNSCVDFIAAARDVGDDSGDTPPGETMVTRKLPATMSMFEISQWLYGDTFRAEEVLFNNPTPNPLAYPQGSTIKVFEA